MKLQPLQGSARLCAAAAGFAVLTTAIVPSHGPVALADAGSDLENVRRLQGQARWAASESLATIVLARLAHDPAPDSLEIAEALFLIGRSRWRSVRDPDDPGLSAAFRSLAIRERRLGPEHLEVAAAHVLVGTLLRYSNQPDSARVHLERGLEIRRARLAPTDTVLADSWGQLGRIQRARGDHQAAVEAWTRALEVRERAHGPDHVSVANLLREVGDEWYKLGDPDRARASLERSLAIFDRIEGGRDHPSRWYALNILSAVENEAGNFGRDLDLTYEALRVSQSIQGRDSTNALVSRLNLCGRLLDVGDPAGARSCALTVLPDLAARYGPVHPWTLHARQVLAFALVVSGDTAAASGHLRAVDVELSGKTGPPHPVLALILRKQAEIARDQGRYTEAIALAERSIRVALEMPNRGQRGLFTADSYRVLIGILLRQSAELALEGRPNTTPALELPHREAASLDSVERELARIAEEYGLASRGIAPSILITRGRVAERLGRRNEAWTLSLEGERLQRERLQANIRTLPDRAALEFSRRVVTFQDLMLDLARDDDPSHLETAWDRLVRRRGMVRDEIARRHLPSWWRSDSALAGAHARWIEAQRRYAQRLVRSGGSGRDSADHAAIVELRLRSEEAERVYAKSLAARGSPLAPANASLADVRSRLLAGQALIGCVETESRSDTARISAFVARGGEPDLQRVELGRSADLSAALEPWLEHLRTQPAPRQARDGRADREQRRLGQRVREQTWDRIAPFLEDANDVFVVADGLLLDLPWHALPDAADRFLVEAGPRIHVLNAERELVRPRPEPPSEKLLAIGAPDFQRGSDTAPAGSLADATVRASPGPCADGRIPPLAPLPGSGVEVHEVARAWHSRGGQARLLMGVDASEVQLKREAPGHAVLHLATHGIVMGDTCTIGPSTARGVGGTAPAAGRRPSTQARVEESLWMGRRVWLALAGANRAREHDRDENEGLLTAEEVVTLDLEGTDWVVLSACHSGLARRWSREGSLGMRRAFHLAGARTVIASQWTVEDQPAREWMMALYAARTSGASTAEALRSARRGVLEERRRTGRSTHPFYWAAFSATGE